MQSNRMAVLVLVSFYIFTLCSCSMTPSQPTDFPTTSTPDIMPSNNDDSSQVISTVAPTTSPNQYEIEDSAIIGDWSICISRFEFADEFHGEQLYLPPYDELCFAIVHATITNNGKTTSVFNPWEDDDDLTNIKCKFVYNQEYEYLPNRFGDINDLIDKAFPPLTEKGGIISTSLPKSLNSDDNELVLQFYLDDGSNNIEFILR